jgi:hypothetical protein
MNHIVAKYSVFPVAFGPVLVWWLPFVEAQASASYRTVSLLTRLDILFVLHLSSQTDGCCHPPEMLCLRCQPRLKFRLATLWRLWTCSFNLLWMRTRLLKVQIMEGQRDGAWLVCKSKMGRANLGVPLCSATHLHEAGRSWSIECRHKLHCWYDVYF